MERVYNISNRGCQFIYHWLFYILAGLRHIEHSGKKVNVLMPWYKDAGFHDDSLKYFEDSFNFLTEMPHGTFEVVQFEGEPLLDKDRIAKDGYLYIRNRLLCGKRYCIDPMRRVYITRKGSEHLNTNKGVLHHSVINEEEMMNLLTFYKFEIVKLEDLSLEQKIELFCNANVIMSPFGGGLTFTAFMNPGQTVIELVKPGMDHNMQHYKVICNAFGISYRRFTDVNYVDEHANIHIQLDNLQKLLSTICV